MPAGERQFDRMRHVPAVDCSCGQRRRQRADCRRSVEPGEHRTRHLIGHLDLPRPGRRIGAEHQPRQCRRIGCRRQMRQNQFRRACRLRSGIGRGRPRHRGQGNVTLGDQPRLDPARQRVADRRHLIGVALECDRVAGFQRQRRGRQRDLQHLVAVAPVAQQCFRRPAGIGEVKDQRRRGGLHHAGHAAQRRHRPREIGPLAIGIAESQLAHRLARVRPAPTAQRRRLCRHLIDHERLTCRRPADPQTRGRIDRAQPRRLEQRCHRRSRRGRPGDGQALDEGRHDCDFAQRHIIVRGNGAQHLIARQPAQPSGQPVTGGVIGTVRPDGCQTWKCRKRPRIPGPQIDPLQHAPAAAIGRIVGRVGPIVEDRPQRLALDQRIRNAVRKMRHAALGALGVGEKVRLVRALVDRAAAGLDQQDRLAHRHPRRGRGIAHPARPVVMGVAPPVHQILDAPHPGLAIGTIADRRARAGAAVGVAGIVPVIALATGDVGAEIVAVVRAVPVGRIRPAAIAPVAQRPVAVDADGIDVRRGPEWVEMEELFAAARLQPGILAPVSAIGQRRRLPEDPPHLSRKAHQ